MSVADAVTFVACMDNANETDASAAAEGCAASTFDAVKACHDGSQGEALLGAASKQYLAAIAGEAHAFIPDVFINNARAPASQRRDSDIQQGCSIGAPDPGVHVRPAQAGDLRRREHRKGVRQPLAQRKPRSKTDDGARHADRYLLRQAREPGVRT